MKCCIFSHFLHFDLLKVHHGGAGTLGASLLAGKPTLIIPFFGDQFLWSIPHFPRFPHFLFLWEIPNFFYLYNAYFYCYVLINLLFQG